MAGTSDRPQPRFDIEPRDLDWRSGFFDALGNSAPNHWVDRAGGHRRVAGAFAALAVPMIVMAWALLIEGGFVLFSLVHLFTAGCLLWVSWDLIGWASLVGRHRLPHSSVIALCLTVVLLRHTRPAELALRLGSVPALLTLGTLVLAVALVILIVDDRNPSPPVALAGRSALILGGAIAGATEIARMVQAFPEYPFYSLGLGGSGMLLGAMAVFEGRLFCRALALAKLGRHRRRR